MNKSVFLTVGTTQFDQLIMSATTSDMCKVLCELGYNRLLLQIGHCQFEPEERELCENSPAIHFYRFKDSLTEDVAAANLVICHAGAGSILEALEAGKPTLVVVNEELMDNHQLELAKQLQKLNHLYYCTCSTLQQTLKEVDFTKLEPYVPGNPAKFVSYLDSVVQKSPSISHSVVFFCHLICFSLLTLLYLWTPVGASILLLTILCLAIFVARGQPSPVQ